MIDEKIKKYFLGEISATEAKIFEEEISLDAELTKQARIIENELTDDYLRNQLSPEAHTLFEKNYLITEARRKKVILAKSLWKIANEQEVKVVSGEPKVSFWQNWNSLRWAVAGFAAILLMATVVLIWRSSGDKQEVVKQENANQTPTPKVENQNIQINQNINQIPNTNLNSNNPNSQTTANIKKVLPTPEIKTTLTPKTVEQSAPTLATFVLLPGTLRGEGEQFIKISPETNKVNLRLGLPKDANKYQTYNATIKTADGETIFNAPNLKSPVLTFSAAKLENRTYIIFLEGQNAQNPAESIAEYTFRVRR